MSWHRTCQEAPVNDAENDKDSHSHWIPLWGSNYLDIISRLDPQIINMSQVVPSGKLT
jgi:phosphoenolpyruvate carboxylase